MKVPIEIKQSVSCLDGPDLINRAYDGLLSLIGMSEQDKRLKCFIDYRYSGSQYCFLKHNSNQRYSKLTNSNFDWLAGLLKGVYIPGTKRDYWVGNFDVNVDEFPKEGCVYIEPPDGSDYAFTYAYVRKIGGFPNYVMHKCPNPVAYYRVSKVEYIPNGSFVSWEFGCKTRTTTCYFAINNDGTIWVGIDRYKMRQYNGCEFYSLKEDIYFAYHFGPGALSLLADRKYLWMVETKEESYLSCDAKLQFGVDQEYVKSLFYSREFPITETGRLRPILHWVRAHKRRISENKDIDITKYLRGVTNFKMESLEFTITSPSKTSNK